MPIKVRYFASLKESLGRSEDILEIEGYCTVAEVWGKVNPDNKLPENILTAVNMNYVTLDTQVNDGDEVAFFPPVTGG